MHANLPNTLVDGFCAALTTITPQYREGADVEQNGRNPDKGYISRE